MRPEQFHSDSIDRLLRRRRVATLDQIKEALGTTVDMTAFRKLRQIDYVRSYSHRGKFYTLIDTADFDSLGLWTHRGVHFSQFGSLVKTVEQFVLRSDRGCVASELASDLKVEVKGPLLQLARAKRLAREPVSGVYVYVSPDPAHGAKQMVTRHREGSIEPAELPWPPRPGLGDDARAAIVLFMATLDEKQRRQFAGLESLRIGRGGDCRVADLTGMDVHTVARGRTELEQEDIDPEHIRRPGGGRKPVEKKRKSSRRSGT